MRSLKIFAVGLVGLITLFAAQIFYGYFLVVAALCPLVFLIVGQFYLPRSRRSIQVWLSPVVLTVNGEPVSAVPGMPLGRLSGKEIIYRPFKQRHDFEIVPYRFWLLLVIGLISLGAATVAWWGKDFLFNRFAPIYLTASIWAPVVLASLNWVRERRMLRLTGLTIGRFSIQSCSRPPFCEVHYSFVDAVGGYRGGQVTSLFCAQEDSMTIIFYNEENPEKSIPASALTFHRLVWNEQSLSSQSTNTQSA